MTMCTIIFRYRPGLGVDYLLLVFYTVLRGEAAVLVVAVADSVVVMMVMVMLCRW